MMEIETGPVRRLSSPNFNNKALLSRIPVPSSSGMVISTPLAPSSEYEVTSKPYPMLRGSPDSMVQSTYSYQSSASQSPLSLRGHEGRSSRSPSNHQVLSGHFLPTSPLPLSKSGMLSHLGSREAAFPNLPLPKLSPAAAEATSTHPHDYEDKQHLSAQPGISRQQLINRLDFCGKSQPNFF